jgi:hypothetical protein
LTTGNANPVSRIVVNVEIGGDRLAASDDPVFVGLRGHSGREFRLAPKSGRAWRRGASETYVLAPASGSENTVLHPELNDPTAPPIDANQVVGVYLRKGLEPIPNVRGHGEMDDRLEVERIEVEIHSEGLAEPLRFARTDTFWLGLVCGLVMEIPPTEAAG